MDREPEDQRMIWVKILYTILFATFTTWHSSARACAVVKNADGGSALVANNKSQPDTNASAVNLITFGNAKC